MRKLLMITGGAVLLLVVVMVALALLVDADQFRPDAEQQASEGLGRQVTIGKLKMSLFAGGVTAENLVIADDPRFSKDPFLSAGSMNIGVDLKELIFSRKLNVHSFLIHAPKLSLVQNEQGQWNYSSLAKPGANPSAPPPASGAPPEFTVGKFTLDDGQVSVHHLASGKTSEYSKLRLEAANVSPTSSFPYKFSAAVPGGGTVEVKGTFGPVAQQSERTPMTAAITVKDFDIAATGFSDPASPLKGLLDMEATVKSDGTRSEVEAHVTGSHLCLAPGCTPGKTPIGIDLTAIYLLADQLANLSSGQIKLGSSTANLSGTVDLKGAKPQVDARIDAASLGVSDIESVLPALGIVLPPGAKLEGGTASVKATAVGLADALVIRGHVGLANSKVTGYDLGSNLSAITKFSGASVGKETVIQQFDSDIQTSLAGSKVNNLLLVLPGLARLTGSGTVGTQNDLNFAMKAQVNLSKSPVGMIGSAFGSKNTSVGIPFHITGTTKDPKFTPDFANGLGLNSAGNLAGKGAQGLKSVGGIAGNSTQGLANTLGGLFGKKK
jgi:AsmA protein